jgi:hypothetical protein
MRRETCVDRPIAVVLHTRSLSVYPTIGKCLKTALRKVRRALRMLNDAAYLFLSETQEDSASRMAVACP